ncbi:hypothetical protein KQI68_00850 [Peptoniphilus sp. MSJ-1]|uniref:Uncharacterized protein n=1 Tax=Peptoniphilus ovalis TaxID=2841503 RepID=A0ABS6FDZ0_9FIRM|nr:hypothetical protein [Peptoniphilus ovalis]MBU5668380.1 hypothetical protein [Peptoniphilus ovalis]
MNKEKIKKILEKVIIGIVTLIMITVLANQYIKTSEGSINLYLRQIQIVLIILVAVLSLIMAIIDKNKSLIVVLLIFYALMSVLFVVFRSANRI